ncbi:MAG: D-alanine--D-alanine ligase [Spirochaetaceae bacterium]|jgi:D-alanine-D-alanine ligase|nr:D-alanine--D-alanine ligase [Spirochaetaceae bacterium]
MKKKLNIGILFGGKSAEHEVSRQSALNVYDAVDRDAYEPYLIGIDKNGRWYFQTGDIAQFVLNRTDPERVKLAAASGRAALIPEGEGKCVYNLDTSKSVVNLDVVFPILHGPLGEDGTVQGLLKLAGIPYVGCGVLASAAGMDKDICKRLLRDSGIPVAPWITRTAHEKRLSFAEAVRALGLPLFIKPANMGSSVGVNKAHNEDEYIQFVNNAFLYDTKILIEQEIKGREIECAVLGNENPAASIPGEVISNHEYYSYEAKYLDENGAALKIPAELSPEKCEAVKALAVKTFTALGCEGLSRVDMFLQADGNLVVNEINTMPGFTKISMYPKLWEASGISYTRLIDRLIQLALERFATEKNLKTTFFN